MVILGTIGGVICGAGLAAAAFASFSWWQSHQKAQALRQNLYRNNNPTLVDSPPTPPVLTPLSMPPVATTDTTPVVSPEPPPPPPIPSYKLAQQQAPSIPSPLPPPLPPDPEKGSVWLDGISGTVTGQRIMIYKEETILGRSSVCDVQFHDPKVSRQHALMRLFNDEYWIQDMQSSRGTLVNGKRVENHALQDKDQIKLGDSLLIFRRS